MVVLHVLRALTSAVEPTANLHVLPRLAHNVANATFPDLQLVEVLLDGGVPVSPALRCVTVLTIFFFSVYLGAVCGRLIRITVSCISSHQQQLSTFEQKISEASEALAIAPMMSIIMISARLRALQLDPSGDPERWVQLCMYASTVAFFLRFALDLALAGPRGPAGLSRRLLELTYGLDSIVLYSCCFAILLNTFLMRLSSGSSGSAHSDGRNPPLPAMMHCIAALAATYLAENLLFEVMAAVWRAYREVPTYTFKDESSMEQGGYEQDRKEISNQQQAFSHSRAEELMMVELVSMQFPLMLCVLLVGITLRAMQLKLEPAAWAAIAMYAVTCSIVVQAVWASSAAVNRLMRSLSSPARMGLAQERSCFEWRQLNRNLQLWPFVAMASAPSPGGADAGAGVRRPLHWFLALVWGAMMATLYIGTTLILINIFTMEAHPLSVLWSEGEKSSLLDVHIIAHTSPPLSVAMRCVVMLTVVYFGAYLCMILGGVVHGPTRKWAASVLVGVQRSLAFVPMLCVMMIAVRLRAMQLKVRDPQSWAQSAMYIATFAVITQVGCSLCSGDGEDKLEDADREMPDIAVKVATIAILSLRYAAAIALYTAVAALIAALLVMEPAQ